MTRSRITSRAGTALSVLGIALALANWYARPGAVWAWAAVLVTFAIMIAVRHRYQLRDRRSPADAAAARSLASVESAVAFGAMMIVIPLAVTLAHAYGLVADADGGQRTTNIILGAYLAVIGNSMPKRLPPLSSMACDGARVQAFQRLVGWTWVLGGLGFAAAWAFLPLAAAGPVSTTIVLAAIVITLVQLLRARKLRVHAPHVSRS